MRNLNLTLVQCELAWEEPAANRARIGELISELPAATDLIVLPEMFTTGFSMNALGNAEAPGGPTEHWMRDIAASRDCAVTGSIALREPEGVYNRMLFVTPEQVHRYDKRHLFRMAGEHRRYRPGKERVVVPWRGWRILLQVCYDLRFPVFSRNLGDYDLALYVANWPSTRRQHWRTLLAARAIENQALVAGVNRVGSDAQGIHYSGDSLAVAANGEQLLDLEDKRALRQVVLEGDTLSAYREKFPFLADADLFKRE